MESAGRRQLLKKIKEIREADFREGLRLHFPDADFAVSIFAEEVTISRFLYLWERVMDQMEAALDEQEWDLLPNSFNFLPIDSTGDVTVFQRFNETLQYFNKKQWGDCLIRLRWHIQYQKANGIWALVEEKVYAKSEQRLAEQVGQVADITSRVKAVLQEIDVEMVNVSESKERLEQFYANKQKELQVITNSVDTVNVQKDAMNTLATTAAELHGQLKAKAEEGLNLVAALQARQSEEQTKFETLKSQIDTTIHTSDERNSQAEAKLKSAEALQKEIESHRDEINKLLGLAADGALGQWFDKRHESLRKSLKFWRWAVPVTTVVALGWAISVFLWIGSSTGNLYLDLGINVIKTVPAWILLAFSLRQYGRERFVEEEYAFRAAISKTIKTYTDMLEKSDTEENKSRNEMLREVLKQIYAMPRLQPEYKPGIMRVRSADLPAVLREVNRALGKGEAEG